jgi:pimeloyl-ACP methyl ester carboxylesterase
MTIQSYRFLGEDYQVYVVLRKPGPPPGYTFQDMANDYAAMIGEEFDGPVDVIGVSTGGSIALNFAADHPELLRRLVVHSSAYQLSEEAKQLQLRMGELAQGRQWAQVSAVLLSTMFPRSGTLKTLSRPLVWLLAQLMSLSAPNDPRDLVVTIEAEDQFN